MKMVFFVLLKHIRNHFELCDVWNNNARVNNRLTDSLRVSLFKFGAIRNSFQAFTKPSIAMIFFLFCSHLDSCSLFLSLSVCVCEMCLAFSAYRIQNLVFFTYYIAFFWGEVHVKWRRFNCTFLMCALTYTSKSCCYTQRQTGDFFPAILFICFNRTYTSSFVQHLGYHRCAYSTISKSRRNVPLNKLRCSRGVCEYECQSVSGGKKSSKKHISIGI